MGFFEVLTAIYSGLRTIGSAISEGVVLGFKQFGVTIPSYVVNLSALAILVFAIWKLKGYIGTFFLAVLIFLCVTQVMPLLPSLST